MSEDVPTFEPPYASITESGSHPRYIVQVMDGLVTYGTCAIWTRRGAERTARKLLAKYRAITESAHHQWRIH